MIRMIRPLLFLSAAIAAFSLGVNAQEQTSAAQADSSKSSVALGDLARQQRSGPRPKAKRVITDDTIAASQGADVPVSQPAPDTPVVKDDKDEKAKEKAVSPEDKEKEQAKPFIEAIDAQKKRIVDAQNNIQQLNEERRQRASAHYADIGLSLRDQQKWNDDEKAIRAQIAEKEKEIQDANVQLEEVRERARKNGLKLPDK